MAFQLAEAYVQLSSQGYKTVTGELASIRVLLETLTMRRSDLQAMGATLAGQAGLVSMVGAAAFAVGQAFGNWAFETERWSNELEKGAQRAKELDQQLLKALSRSFNRQVEDIELIRNPEAKRAAYQSLITDLDKNIAGVEKTVRDQTKAVEDWNAAWQITGNRKAYAEQAKADLAASQQRLQLLQEEREKIADLTGERAREIATKKQNNALIERSEQSLVSLREEVALLRANNDERYKMLAAQAAPAGIFRREVEDLMREADALREKAAEEQRLNAERENGARLIERVTQTELQRLQEQRIALEHGKEAAHAFRLEKMGLDPTMAKQIARQQAILDAEKDLTKEKERQQAGYSELAALADKMQQDLFDSEAKGFDLKAANQRLADARRPEDGLTAAAGRDDKMLDDRLRGMRQGAGAVDNLRSGGVVGDTASSALARGAGGMLSDSGGYAALAGSMDRLIQANESMLALATGSGLRVAMNDRGGGISLPAASVQFGALGDRAS